MSVTFPFLACFLFTNTDMLAHLNRQSDTLPECDLPPVQHVSYCGHLRISASLPAQLSLHTITSQTNITSYPGSAPIPVPAPAYSTAPVPNPDPTRTPAPAL